MVREPEGGDAAGGRQPAQEADHDDRLIGWKAIAAYLGRDIRTVQRWELAEKLPVHR